MKEEKKMSVDETIKYFVSKGAKLGQKTSAILMPISKELAENMKAKKPDK